MNREIKVIEVSKGMKVEIKAYLTGKEANDIKQAMFAGIDVQSDEAKVSKFPLGLSVTRERELIRSAVISVNGSTAQPLVDVENLPLDDYKTIVAELEKIVNKNF